MLWGRLEDGWPKKGPEIEVKPLILVVDETWQRQQCRLLDLACESVQGFI